jgi:ubiquitin carboxyl-terminal hydrolase 34
VDAAFLPDEQMDVDSATLLAPKFLGAARPILREDKGFLAKVLPNLGIDANELRAYVIRCFVEANGPRHLAKMIRANLNQACRDDFLLKMVTFVEFAQTTGVYAVFYHDKRDALTQPQSEQLAEALLDIFDTVDKQLLCSLDKQQDILSVETRRTLYDFQIGILGSLFRLTPDKTLELFVGIVGDDTVVTEGLDGQYRDVAIMIWKLKLMIAYMTKARMDLRVQGVDIMARELVEFFTTNKSKSHNLRFSDPHPMLCFVADFLLKQKVTEYLLGVASHPQLLSRCSNVIGFLVVTNKFSRYQAQLVWRTIKDSQDPRVVHASIPILTHLVKQLTDFEENVMFAELALSEPLPPMSMPAIDFFLELLAKLRQGVQDYHYQTKDRVERFYRIPLEFAIELIRAMSPTKLQPLNPQIVYDHAAEVLSSLASITPLSVRKAILEKCIDVLTNGSEDGAAVAHSINSVLRLLRPLPKDQINELRLATILMQEFCRFVSSKRDGQVRMNQQLMNLEVNSRLDLIWLLVPLDDEDDIDQQLLKQFWSHLVGADALNNAARDVAWHRLAMINFTAGMDSGFLDRHKNLLSPTEIDSNLLTNGFFQFAQKLSTAQIRMQAIPEFAEDGSLKIAGLDLIWNAILRAPKAVNDEAPLQYLVKCYSDSTWFHRANKAAVEKTHIAVVQDNIKRLKSAFATIHQSEPDCNDGKDSGTGMLMSAEIVEEATLTFLRVIKFLRKFLFHVRTSKDYRGQGSVTIDMTDDATPPQIRGEPLSIKCDIMRAGQKNITRMLAMGSQDTCKQLYTRVCILLSEYNVASFQVITGGKRCYLRDQPRMTLEEFGTVRTPHLIIREANSTDDPRKDYIIPSPQWRSAFEHELVNHLNILYDFMDGSDMASGAVRDLLKCLPRYRALSDAISNTTAAPQDLFPLAEPCKAFYSIDTIREILETGTVDNDFLVYAVQVLETALPTEEQLAQRVPLHIELITETVNCLYDLFLASGSKELDLFSDVGSVVRRLISLCALTMPLAQHGGLTWDSYELTIDLLSSRQPAWNEFITHPQVAHVHESLFLTHHEAFVRRFAYQLISRKLTQWHTSEGVSLVTFVLFLWKIIAERIPLVASVPHKATESFDIALLLYKTLLASETLNEQQVIGPFRIWATLILRHQHHELVGRDDPDPVLRGLATLMLYTLKSFPNVISSSEKIELIQAIWWRFLFQRAPNTDAEASLAAQNLPVLETNTRMDLILLIAELASDDDSITIMGRVLDQLDIRPVDRQTDRTALLKAPAGYIGLSNLGQTCYMNSLVTQLFMNPILRAFILSCAQVTNISASPLLYETQRLFANMQSSFSSYVSGLEFTSKIDMVGNEKIDVRDQMDVDEFMNLLFNRWEEQMPSSELKERFLSIYRSTTIQQIKSKECEHVSEKEEVLTAIPCDVQGNADLETSLRGFVQGDVMEGGETCLCHYTFTANSASQQIQMRAL